MKGMFVAKLKLGGMLLLALSVLAAGAGLAAQAQPKDAKHARTDRYGDPLPDGALTRLGTVRPQAKEEFFSVALSRDGRTVATGGVWKLRLWEAATGKMLREFTAHQAGVLSVDFSPDSKTLASAGHDGAIRVWEVSTSKKVREFTGYSADAVAFSPDGKMLASANIDQSVRLWEVATGKQICQFSGHRERVRPVTFSPDGKLLASASGEGTIRLWDVSTQGEIRRFTGFLRAAFSPDGEHVAVAAEDSVDLLQLFTWKRVRHFPGKFAFAFSPDGAMLATIEGKDYNTIALSEVSTGKVLRLFKGHTKTVWSVVFSPEGSVLVTGSYDGTVLVWSLSGLIAERQTMRQGHRARENFHSKEVALSLKDVQDYWTDLAGDNAPKAYRAIWALVSAPKQAVPFLGDHLQPKRLADPERERLAQLLRDLDSDRFRVREQATRELEKGGEFAASALRRALQRQPSLEVRRRAEQLLEKLEDAALSGDELRASRALQVLEHIGTPGARKVLETLARGVPEARLTQEAKASLERLAKRPAAKP